MCRGTCTSHTHPQPPCVESYGTPYPAVHQLGGVYFLEGVGWLLVGVSWGSVGGWLRVGWGSDFDLNLGRVYLSLPQTGPKT